MHAREERRLRPPSLKLEPWTLEADRLIKEGYVKYLVYTVPGTCYEMLRTSQAPSPRYPVTIEYPKMTMMSSPLLFPYLDMRASGMGRRASLYLQWTREFDSMIAFGVFDAFAASSISCTGRTSRVSLKDKQCRLPQSA